MKFKLTSLTVAFCALFCFSASSQVKDIVGTWKLVSQKITQPDGRIYIADSASLNSKKIYTPTTFVNIGERVIPEAGGEKLIVSCAGGRYSIKGNVYEEFTEFATWRGHKNLKVKFVITMEQGKIHTLGALSGLDGVETIYDEWFVKID